ncbi:MAG: GNAT family N-acetyltransferase [Chloroflexota bacterium]
MRHDSTIYPDPRFAIVTASSNGPDGAGAEPAVVAAALQTPPHRLVLALPDNAAGIDHLADELAADHLPGVVGPSAAARRFAQRWTARTGQKMEAGMAERTFRLRTVRQQAPGPGQMRVARTSDRNLLEGWLRAFAAEALGETFENAAEAAGRWISGRGRTMYFWDHDDRTVSMCGAGGQTPNGIRVGPVYTPPAERGQGYATSLVAVCSQVQLDEGHASVFLFTDRANPTSNRIYESIGYEPVIDVDQYDFLD